MGGVDNSHCRWIRRYVIPGKVGKWERDKKGTGRDDQWHMKTQNKGPNITPGIPGVLHQDVYSNEPTT